MGRPSIVFFSALAALLIVPTACATPPVNLAATPGTPAPPPAVTLRWRACPQSVAEQELGQRIADGLSAQLATEGIALSYDPAPVSGYLDNLKADFAAGRAPDIVWLPGADVASFAARGELLDLNLVLASDPTFQLDGFDEVPLRALQGDGELWGLPSDMSTLVLYYNKTLCQSRGVDDPAQLAAAGQWDWDHLKRVANELTDPTQAVYGLGLDDSWQTWACFVYAADGNLFSLDRTACAMHDRRSRAGLQYLADLVLQDKAALPPGPGAGAGLQQFLAGRVGMFPGGRELTPVVREGATFDWGVVEMPKGPVGQVTWLTFGCYAINARSSYLKEAWTALKALTSAEVQAQVAAVGGAIPTRRDEAVIEAFLMSSPPADNQPFLAGTHYALVQSPIPDGAWSEIVEQHYQPAVHDILTGKASVAEATDRACSEANLLLAGGPAG